MTKIDRNKLYIEAESFFSLSGSNVMKISSNAAAHVCEKAESEGVVITRIEGGIWHSPGFESRLDCIWDRNPSLCRTPSLTNEKARNFIVEESDEHNVFILSSKKIDEIDW